MNSIDLKWGTVKGWNIEDNNGAKEALQKWADFGVCMSAALQKDTKEQRQALIDALDYFDSFYLDWEGKEVSREEAKEYILNYGNEN